jgi:UDP:flavonoid glycosyltransferase YjiC (YdhE family)
MRILQVLLPFGGNFPPQIAITRELVERGHRVRVLAFRAGRERIEATGAEFVAFHGWNDDADLTREDGDFVRDWEKRTQLAGVGRMLDAGIAALPASVASTVAALKAEPADVVVNDFLFAGVGVAAEHAGVPVAALVHCPYPTPIEGAPPLFSGAGPMVGPLGAARDRVLNAMTNRIVARGVRPLNDERAKLRLPPLDGWYDQLLGADAIYVLTAPELDFLSRGKLPANVRYMGPSFEPHSTEWESPWRQSNADPLVVVSVSTTFMNQVDMVQRVLDALARLRVRTLVTAGPALDVGALRLPSNARVVGFVPHLAVLPHASLVVTHAGWQTINAALACGVPLVCIPSGRDQPDNAARVVHTGVGVRARKSASVAKLRSVIRRALDDPALKLHAADMARALGRSDGTTATADAIEALAKRRDTSAVAS